MGSNLFKVINVVTALLCVGVILFNNVSVDVRSSEQATSSIGGDQFEYQCAEDSFSFKKNGNVVGRLNTDGKMEILRGGLMLNCNAVVVGAKTIASSGAAGVATGAAGAVAGAAAPTAALSAVGFGGSGVIAGSAAAAAQSAIGNVVAGSLFAKLTAAGFAAVTPAVIVPAAVIGAVAALGVA